MVIEGRKDGGIYALSGLIAMSFFVKFRMTWPLHLLILVSSSAEAQNSSSRTIGN
jgi:hypothetical protein